MYGSAGASIYPETQSIPPAVPKFLVRGDHIRARDGVSRVEALRRARKEYPSDHAAFAQWKDRSSDVAKAAGFDPLQPRGRTSTHKPYPYQTATWPATQAPKRSPEWDDAVDAI